MSRVGAAGAAWLGEALERAGEAQGLASFARDFAAAGRRLGHVIVHLTDEERAAGAPAWLGSWALDDCGRVALLVVALRRLPPQAHAALLGDLYRQGALREQQGVLRALSWLPDPARFVEIAADACRTHVQPVFEALACDNPYPAAWLPSAVFDQMVVKALFTGAPLDRILGLADRTTPELLRMAEAFASERRAAGRPVPDDVARLGAMAPRRAG